MVPYFWVGVAGFFGALARFLLTGYIASRTLTPFPLGTLVVNVTGSILLGFLVTVGIQSIQFPANLKPALAVGFLGSYTTFSTWSYETLQLMENGNYVLAALNVLVSMITGLAGMWAGFSVGRLFS
ncbi:MAG: fluoride efflux transporter CrcB [Firmicutes bacterium]|nr:fluoride efflux transporter CrcB [Bacillota bacterium]